MAIILHTLALLTSFLSTGVTTLCAFWPPSRSSSMGSGGFVTVEVFGLGLLANAANSEP
jgi:hypothetical protein